MKNAPAKARVLSRRAIVINKDTNEERGRLFLNSTYGRSEGMVSKPDKLVCEPNMAFLWAPLRVSAAYPVHV